MKTTFLDFEQPVAELEARIDELRFVQDDSAVDISDEIERLSKKSAQLTKELYARPSPWQAAQVARHPQRNFGMPRPEGYRKAERLMRLAEKFSLPMFTFIDTPGAYPGIGAEERGQSEAIGRNLYVMTGLRTPIIATVIGEGGSGGALAIAVADSVLMLHFSTYSVISPEGCASILWKSAAQAPQAAEALGLTAQRLKTLGLIDKIVSEPLGGAHRAPEEMAATLRRALTEALRSLQAMSMADVLERRIERLMKYGKFREAAPGEPSRR